MDKDEEISFLKITNRHLLNEVSAMSAQSLRRELVLAKLEAEVTNLKRAQHLAERADPVGRCPHCTVNIATGAVLRCELCSL